jgi:hypothetical protein
MCGWEILPPGSSDPQTGTVYPEGALHRGQEYQGRNEGVSCGQTNSAALQSDAFSLGPGQSNLISIGIPPGQISAGFFTGIDGSTVDTTLTAPDGTTIDPETDPAVNHFKGPTYELYEVSNPQPGTWQMNVMAVDVPTEGESVSTLVSLKRCVGVPEGSAGDPCVADDDADSVNDDLDNCPLDANPGQENADGDYWGDACDDDDDNDAFDDGIEIYLTTDPLDACPDDPTDDAWPLDVSKDGQISVVGDVLNFRDRIGATPGDPNWWQRLDYSADGQISVVGDVLMYRGRIGETCE